MIGGIDIKTRSPGCPLVGKGCVPEPIGESLPLKALKICPGGTCTVVRWGEGVGEEEGCDPVGDPESDELLELDAAGCTGAIRWCDVGECAKGLRLEVCRLSDMVPMMMGI